MQHLSTGRPTVALINHDNLSFNFHSVRKFIGEKTRIMAVVKANAYGHGSVECAETLAACGADWLAVAIPEEGVPLREAGLKTPILCLGGFWSGQEQALIQYRITPVIFSLDHCEMLNSAAKQSGARIKAHMKIDTGMGRVGVRWKDLREFLQKFRTFDFLDISGVMTHFAAADDLSENEFTIEQTRKFDEAVETIRENGFDPEIIDLANSPAAVAHPDTRRSLVRLGGVLYGLGGDVLPAGSDKPELKPVMSVHTRIAYIKTIAAGETIGYSRTFTAERETMVATVPIGYHDGFPRVLSNRAEALVGGKRVSVIGRISMDWTTLDVTDVPGAKIGDEVVIVGRQGSEEILSEDLAEMADTISYEITCGFTDRVPRMHI